MCRLCYIVCCLIALWSCTAESVKENLLRQEQDIEKYIKAVQDNQENPIDTVYYFDGVYRIVLGAGSGEGAAAGDSVIFDYQACVFSSGKGAMYDTGSENGTLGSGSYFTGLETGLTGMQEGEHAQIILSSEKGYGRKSVGIVPPNSPLIFEVIMTRVVKN